MVIIQPCKKGNVQIDQHIVTEQFLRSDEGLKIFIQSRGMLPGKITRLLINGKVWMTDSYGELKDHQKFVQMAEGNVLIGGLGLGAILNDLLKKPNISITVLEKNKNVIALVAPHFPQVKIIHADAFTWKPDQYFDYAWWDIWAFIEKKNVPEMDKLMRKYRKYVTKQMCWCRKECLLSFHGKSLVPYFKKRLFEDKILCDFIEK